MAPDADPFAPMIEHVAAYRTPTPHLYHYTNAAAALKILATGKLRLSPVKGTNDLWESRPTYHPLSSGYESMPPGSTYWLWQLLDRRLRAYTKVACLTRDFDVPDGFPEWRDAFRGWSHLSLWAHYGDGHRGVCLRFEQGGLEKALQASKDEHARVFAEPVSHIPHPNVIVRHLPHVSDAREFGVHAVAAVLVERHHRALFFEKHLDWASESEYRLLRMDESTQPFYLDIRSALTAVIVGTDYEASEMPALRELLGEYPRAEPLQRVDYHNRFMHLLPPESAPGLQPAHSPPAQLENWAAPSRSGTLAERMNALLAAEDS